MNGLKRGDIFASAMLLLCALADPLRAQDPADAFADDVCSAASSPILILGTYHMANPGLDSYNVEADDVRSPRRQREVSELLDRLERFRPTVIAVEGKFGRDTWPERYALYLKGEYELGRNEIEQIGFKLARRLGLSRIEPVDYPMWMNGWRNDEIDWERLDAQRAEQVPSETEEEEGEPAPPTESQRRLLESTITDYLRWLNSPEEIRDGHAVYMRLLLPPDGIGIYSRTDQVRNWYERNLRIFTNLNRITEHGADRVLLIIGSGHLAILRDFAVAAPYFCLVDTEAYLRSGQASDNPR